MWWHRSRHRGVLSPGSRVDTLWLGCVQYPLGCVQLQLHQYRWGPVHGYQWCCGLFHSPVEPLCPTPVMPVCDMTRTRAFSVLVWRLRMHILSKIFNWYWCPTNQLMLYHSYHMKYVWRFSFKKLFSPLTYIQCKLCKCCKLHLGWEQFKRTENKLIKWQNK